MAWTKVKTAAVVAVVVVLAIGTTTITVKQIGPVTAEEAFEHYDSIRYLNRAPGVILLRPTQYANQGTWINGDNTRMLGRNRSLAWVLADAYRTGPQQMILPADFPAGGFDYLVTSSTNPSVALQAEIKKQFGLTALTETQTTNVLVLKVSQFGSPGLKLNSRISDSSILIGADTATLHDFSMSSWAQALGGYLMNTLVVDETGLSNHYDFILKWNKNINSVDAMNQVLQNQLGLELVPARRPVEMLVVNYDDGHNFEPPLGRASWEFKGYTTPEDTFESMLCAMNQGDDKAFLVCLTPNCQTQFLDKHRGGPNRNLVAMNQGRAAKIGAYQILSEERPSDSETILFVRSTKLGKAQFTLKMLAGEWKVDQMPD